MKTFLLHEKKSGNISVQPLPEKKMPVKADALTGSRRDDRITLGDPF